MKDEIKEILDILQKCKDYDDEVYLIKQHGATLLLDYITNLQTIEQQYSVILSENAELENKITNLQEENERLKADYGTKAQVERDLLQEENKNKTDYICDLVTEKINYKSRIDKAIEYIKEKSEEVELNFYGFPDKITSFKGSVSNLLNILQGSDNSE